MIFRMIQAGVFAGFAAGIIAAVLHFALVQNLILLGERYESGELTHFESTGGETAGDDHNHTHSDGTVHDHSAEPGAETGGGAIIRNVLTVLFTASVYIGYGILLAAGMAVAGALGQTVGAKDGLLWGIAGFAALQLAPALGLPPEMPGTPAADLTARQVWWLGTAIATGAGLAALAYLRNAAGAAVAVVLVVLPHVIGAPQLEEYAGSAPPELAAVFSARALAVGLVAWVVLGFATARLWSATGHSTA